MQNENFGFIIPFYITEQLLDEKTLLVKCIRSIRNIYPNIKIVIINDCKQNICSDDKIISYFNDKNIIIEQTIYNRSAEMAPFYYFYVHHPFKYAIMMHDSCLLTKKLPIIDYDVKFLWHFIDHLKWDDLIVQSDDPNIKTHSDEIKHMVQKISDCDFKQKFNEIYTNRDNWYGCLGTMVIISHNFLIKLQDNTKILDLAKHTKIKSDRYCLESIIALAIFFTKDFDFLNCSLQGNYKDDQVYTESYLGKYCGKYFTKQSQGR